MNIENNERDWNALWIFREACRRKPGLNATPPSTVQEPVAKGSPLARAVARLAAKTAGTGAEKTQAAPATPGAGDPLTRAIERLVAAGQAPGAALTADDTPLARAIQKLIDAAPTKVPGASGAEAADALTRACKRLERAESLL